MSTERKGMGTFGVLTLLFIGGLAWMTIENAVSEFRFPGAVVESGIHASDDCYEQDSANWRVGLFGVNQESIRDTDCEKREAARLASEAGMPEVSKRIICGLAGSIATFGDAERCMAQVGNATTVIVEVADRGVYCDKRSKKWYKRLTFRVKHNYRKCMRGEV